MHRVVVGISAQNASATDRVILAFNPPTQETNLFWNGIGEKMASMQSLVGNDPLTGAYDNSELAAEWSANEAMNRALDRKQMIEILYDGRAELFAQVRHCQLLHHTRLALRRARRRHDRGHGRRAAE